MHLQKWDWFDEQVIASADEVNVQEQVVPDEAVDSFIVVDGVPWFELDDNFFVGIPGESALDVVEGEDVVGVSKKLILSFKLRVVCYG